MLGGLDRPTFGNIQIDGIDMQSFTQADYESYRNSYVGFVFQEYNLLDDFNVKDNVALALQLSKGVNIDEKVREALRQVELGEEYLTRRVGELSGGEKQRVAIARAIVKDSKMILADEPTGNLDSETGESIWSILKNLSVTRQVIIVSHDRESAEKYADRIIEISDGKVIADNGTEQTKQQSEQQKFVLTKKQLSFAMLIKMGFNNLIKHKVRAICVILVSVFAMSALLVAQIMTTFLPERSIAQYIKLHDAPYVTLSQGSKDEIYGLVDAYDSMSYGTRQYIKQNAQTLDWGIVESKQEALDFGFEFIGDALELDSQSFYIDQSLLEKVRNNTFGLTTNTVIVDGEENSLCFTGLTDEQLVGKQVRLEYNGNQYYKLAGVFKPLNVDVSTTWTTKDFCGHKFRPIVGVSLGKTNGYVLKVDDNEYGDSFRIDGSNYLWGNVITSDGILNLSRDIALTDDEIVISFGLYSKLFNGGVISDYVVDNQLVKMPSVLDKTVTIEVRDSKTDNIAFDAGKCKIKGIVLEKQDVEIYGSAKFYNSADANFGEIIVKTDSVFNIQFFLANLRAKYTGRVIDVGTIESKNENNPKLDISKIIYKNEDIYKYGIILLAICVVLVLVMVLLAINVISFSINNRKKEIGILSAIGSSAWDIIKIFIIETLIMSMFIFVLTLIVALSAVGVCNLVFTTRYALVHILTFFVLDPYSVLTLFGACFVVLPLFALLPAIRIARLKPIDAIRVL